MAKTETKEMMVPITATAIELYEGGILDAVLAKIEEKARKLVPDISTRVGREAIRSNAAKVTTSKTYLFQVGKDLTEEHRAKVTSINSVRNGMEERLNALKDEVRKPLTEYEEEEKARIAEIEYKVVMIIRYRKDDNGLYDAAHWAKLLEEIKGLCIDESFGDSVNIASIEKEKSIEHVEVKLAAAKKSEDDQAELEKLRAEVADREEKDRKEREEKERLNREERIKKDAAEEATRKANEESEARIREAQEREEKALREKQEAEERVERAATAERQRLEREAEEARLAAEKREANKKHCAKINNAAVKAIIKASKITEAQAKEVIKAIATGKVPNTSVQY